MEAWIGQVMCHFPQSEIPLDNIQNSVAQSTEINWKALSSKQPYIPSKRAYIYLLFLSVLIFSVPLYFQDMVWKELTLFTSLGVEPDWHKPDIIPPSVHTNWFRVDSLGQYPKTCNQRNCHVVTVTEEVNKAGISTEEQQREPKTNSLKRIHRCTGSRVLGNQLIIVATPQVSSYLGLPQYREAL